MKVILFDIDNTLLSFDEYVKSSMKSGFERFGLGAYKDEMFLVFQTINNRLWRALEKGETDFYAILKCRWNLIFESLGIKAEGEAFEKYFSDCLNESAIAEDGAMEILEYLHGKYRLFAASNGPYEQQRNRLEIAGMLTYFENLFISGRIGFSKPSEEFFSACMEGINHETVGKIHKNEILMIGDSLSADIAGASRFGLKTCYFNPAGKADLGEVMPDYTVSSLSEIRAFL